MKLPHIAPVALAAALAAGPAGAAPDRGAGDGAAELSAELSAVYAGWSEAMAKRDRAGWAATTAQYRQYSTRNLIVSQMKRWPDALFSTLISPPDISSMTLARTMVKGPTAQLVYFGKADFGVAEDDEIPDGLLILMFVREPGGWKFNTSRYMSMAGAEEVIDAARAGDFSFLDSPQFQPPGKVPPVPKLCPVPEVVGFLDIMAAGFEAKLVVNDRSQHVVIDNVQTGLIIGGLKRGINPISVELRELPAREGAPEGKPPKRRFAFDVLRKAKNPDDPPVRIYSSSVKTEPGRFTVLVRGDG